MTTSLKIAAHAANDSQTNLSIDATGEAYGSLTPELVIALCGPIGSPLHETAVQMSNILGEFGYSTECIRLSSLIRINSDKTKKSLDTTSKFSEIQSLIDIGDELRSTYGSDILAKLAIAKISADRKRKYGEFQDVAGEAGIESAKKIKNQRICHIIDSVKNKAELDLLQLIYGEALFFIGVFSPLEIRSTNLAKPGYLKPEEINKLIDTDSGEEFSHGQRVRDTFPRADFFLRTDYPVVGPLEGKALGQITEKLRRFFDLIFRSAVITPTPEETAMYAAASAARNSACLSRQVGAAVTSFNGELLA
ncbi:hypothetical protein, partial [Chitinimonas sp.]|uniref:hypothetical protein n=1 Tax=Chitinimonas sp. TaxID=1934313 RepID=UPI002F91CDA4